MQTGQPLFDPQITHRQIAERHGQEPLLLFALDERGLLRPTTGKEEWQPKAGWTVLVLGQPQATDEQAAIQVEADNGVV